MSLSIQKFSSNVVEKCFEFAEYVCIKLIYVIYNT